MNQHYEARERGGSSSRPKPSVAHRHRYDKKREKRESVRAVSGAGVPLHAPICAKLATSRLNPKQKFNAVEEKFDVPFSAACKLALLRAFKQTCLKKRGDGHAYVEPDEFPMLPVNSSTLQQPALDIRSGRISAKKGCRGERSGYNVTPLYNF